jgi:hypothetical protein
MYSHRGTFNVVFQVTTAAAVHGGSCLYIAKPAFYFSKLIPKSPKYSAILFKIHLLSYKRVRMQANIFENCTDLQKTYANKDAKTCMYEKHNILAMFPSPWWAAGPAGHARGSYQ